MGGTINEQYPVGVTKDMALEQQIRDLKAELENCKLNWKLTQGRATKWAKELQELATKADQLRQAGDWASVASVDERDALRAELAAAKNLLARIHRDGGHYTEAVGVTNSIADAHEKWSEMLLENYNLKNDLTAAKDKFTVMKGYIDSFERTLEKAGVPKSNSEGDPFLWNERVGLLAEQSTALAADNARLRKAVQPFADRIKLYPPWMWTAMVEREKQGGITGGFTVGGEAVTHMPAMLLAQAEEALTATPAQSLAAHDAAVKVAVLREVAKRFAYRRSDGDWTIHPDSLTDEADRIEQEAHHG